MKKIAYILIAALTVFACAKEEINHPSEAAAPKTASAYAPVISVDQEINQVTFSVDSKAVIPVWLFQDKDGAYTEYKAQNGFKRIFAVAGDYKVRMKIMNASGVTPDYVETTFHIDNTIANFDRFVTFLAGGNAAENSKEWRIDGDVAEHMGCGEPGTAGVNWWAAAPGEKAAFGVYEDRVTFTGDGSYTYNPGEDGGVYVNKDVTASPFVEQKDGATEDYVASVSAQTATYEFTYRGNDLYLVLPAHTLFPYIDNDDFWAAPEFKVLSITRETLELVHDNGSIAWHFILTSKAAAYVFKGFKYNADSNLWKPADAAHTFSYYYAPGWAQIDNPETLQEGAEYTLTFPAATSDQWQAQFFIIPDEPVVLSADKNYDFSVIVNTNKALPGVTFKLTDVGDDGNFLFANREPIEAGETIYYLTDLKGIDAPNGVKMVFDFGGNADGTVVSLANIVIKDHAIDDGTVLPSEEPGGDEEEDEEVVIYGKELWAASAVELETWFSPADWSGGLDPQAAYADGKLTLTVPEGVGGSEWQGQVKLHTDIAIDPAKKYAFRAKINASSDGVITAKMTSNTDPGGIEFFYDNGVELTAYNDLAFEKAGVSMAIEGEETVMVVFDFGRLPAGTEISVSEILLNEVQSGAISYGDNLWDGSAELETWFSPADWSGGLDPQAAYADGKLTLTVPEGVGGSEWQGQVKLHSSIVIDPDKMYSFSAKVNAGADGAITAKMTSNTDPGGIEFFYDNGIAVSAFEDVVIKKDRVQMAIEGDETIMIVFDFGRLPAGTEVTVSDITIQEISLVSYGENIWDTAAELETWFSPADWSGGLDPQAAYADGKLTLTVPEGVGGSEWQGQVKLHTAIPIKPGNLYTVSLTLNASADGTATVKMTSNTDPGGIEFFYDNAVNLTAFENVVYTQKGVSMDNGEGETLMLVLDFGRFPAGTEIEVSDIILREAE